MLPVSLSVMAWMKQHESVDVCPDCKCLSGLQVVAVRKFVGFDDKGIGNVVVLDYHVVEMGYHSSA